MGDPALVQNIVLGIISLIAAQAPMAIPYVVADLEFADCASCFHHHPRTIAAQNRREGIVIEYAAPTQLGVYWVNPGGFQAYFDLGRFGNRGFGNIC